MGKSFQFVANHQGLYLAFNQNSLKPAFEKVSKESFTGACVGSVAALLEAVFLRNALSRGFFKTPIIPLFRPADVRCITLQREYETDNENFFTIFIREKLKISHSGFPDRTEHCGDIRETLKNIEEDIHRNKLLLLTISFLFKTAEGSCIQEHKMCVLKHDGYYLFFDPNSGVAIFNNKKNMEDWLKQEVQEGALSHFYREEQTRLRIYDNLTNPVKEGLLSIQTIRMESFSYSAENNYVFTARSCL